MLTNLQLGAKVLGVNNEELGKVKFLIARPNTDQITHLIVEKGLLDLRQVVVPVNNVTSPPENGTEVQLNLTKAQLEDLPDFIERDYSQALESLKSPGILYPIFEGPDTTNSYIANFEALPYSEKVNVASNSLIIEEGASVEALDGQVGKIKEVQFDASGAQVSGFIVEKGLFFHEDFYVPVNLVKRAGLEGVLLTAKKADLQPETHQEKA